VDIYSRFLTHPATFLLLLLRKEVLRKIGMKYYSSRRRNEECFRRKHIGVSPSCS